MCVWCVAMYGLHGGKVLVTHMKHLGTFPWSQMGWTVLQGGRFLILVPVLLQKHTQIRFLVPAGVMFEEQSLAVSVFEMLMTCTSQREFTVSLIMVILHGSLICFKVGMVLMTPDV